jgi:hypothetical protein
MGWKTLPKIEASNWKPIHTSILVYTSKGMGVTDIAKQLDVSRAFVYFTKNSEYFKAKLAAYNDATINKVGEVASQKQANQITSNKALLDQAKGVLEDAAVEAAEKIRILARRGTAKERVQLEACREILDRVNIKGKETIVTETRAYSPEEIASAKQTLLEIEAITARVSTTKSRFVLSREESPDVAERPILPSQDRQTPQST